MYKPRYQIMHASDTLISRNSVCIQDTNSAAQALKKPLCIISCILSYGIYNLNHSNLILSRICNCGCRNEVHIKTSIIKQPHKLDGQYMNMKLSRDPTSNLYMAFQKQQAGQKTGFWKCLGHNMKVFMFLVGKKNRQGNENST